MQIRKRTCYEIKLAITGQAPIIKRTSSKKLVNVLYADFTAQATAAIRINMRAAYAISCYEFELLEVVRPKRRKGNNG